MRKFNLIFFLSFFLILFIYLLFAARSSHYFSSRVPHILKAHEEVISKQFANFFKHLDHAVESRSQTERDIKKVSVISRCSY